MFFLEHHHFQDGKNLKRLPEELWLTVHGVTLQSRLLNMGFLQRGMWFYFWLVKLTDPNLYWLLLVLSKLVCFNPLVRITRLMLHLEVSASLVNVSCVPWALLSWGWAVNKQRLLLKSLKTFCSTYGSHCISRKAFRQLFVWTRKVNWKMRAQNSGQWTMNYWHLRDVLALFCTLLLHSLPFLPLQTSTLAPCQR